MAAAFVAAVAKVFTAAVFKKVLITVAVNLVLSKVSKALSPKAPRPKAIPIDVEYFDTVASRRILYGKNKVGGLNTIPPLVTGGSGESLHQVLTLAGHEVEAIDEVWFDTEQIGTRDGSGNVTSGTYTGKASVRTYLGTSTQTVDSALDTALSEWTSDHRGRGIAYLALTFTYDTNVYRNGKPEITAVVRGKKVYDPRLDSSPGANPTTAAYIAYSTNPALCLADYLISSYGLSETAARIDWALVVAAANICDELVAIPGSTTQKRYTCNVVLEATTDFESNIEALARAMMGVCYYSGGKWRIYAGAWSTSAFTLTESDIIGEVSIQTATSRKGEGFYNAVRGRFIDPERNYQAVEFEPILNSTYETADGERIYTEVDFAACNNQYEAQRNAILLSRQSRRQRTVSVVCSMAAYKIRPYETGTVTIAEAGWTNQPVRCVGWRFRPDPAVELVLQEAGSTDWSDPSSGTYVTPASVSITNPTAYRPGTPTSFTATTEAEAILLSWVAPSNTVPGILYQLFEHTSASPFSSATKIYEGADTQVRVPKSDITTRYYWVRAYWPSTGGFSDETPSGNGLSTAAKPATINAYLTNEAVAVPAAADGTVSSFAAAIGDFKVYSGTTDVTASATFSVVSQTDCTGEINTATNTPVNGQAKGYYRVTALSADIGRLTVRAVYGTVTTDKVFTVAKAKAGAAGSSGNRGAGTFQAAVGESGTGYNFSSADALAWDGGTLADALAQEAVAYILAQSGSSSVEPRDTLTIYEAGTRAAQRIYTGARKTSTTGVVAGDWSTKVEVSIDGSLIVSGTLSASKITTGTLSASRVDIDGLSLTNSGGKLAISSGGVTTTYLGNGAVTDTKLADGAVSTSKIADSALSVAKFASGIRPVEIVSSLPSSGNVEGRTVYLTTDDKLYRWTGSAWTAAVPAADITGTLGDSQIAALAASKITGQLSDSQLAAIAAAKVTGTLTNSQIADLAATKITGTLTNSQIADLAATKITGTLTNSQIADLATSKLTGQITTTQITDNAVTTAKVNAAAITTAKIAASAVTASEIASDAITSAKISAGAITTAKIAANAVTANEIASNAITAAKISAGAVETAKIAAGAITANEIASNAITAVKISAGAIETAKIATGAVTADTIASNAITAVKVSAGAIEAAKIATGAVETVKLAASAVTADKIATNAITADKISANAITAGKIAAAAVSTTELAARSISAEKLRIGSLDNLVSNGNFAAGDMSDMRIWSGTWTAVARNAAGVPAGANSTHVAKGVATGITEASFFTGAKAYTDTDSFLYAVQCKPGEVFYISADGVAASGTTGTLSLYVFHYVQGAGASGSDLSLIDSKALTTSWQTLSGRFTVPANVIGFWIYFYGSSLTTNGTIFGSNLRIIRAATGELVVDGAITAAKLEADLVLASTFKTASSGYRTEISNSGSYPIWYGTGTKNDTNGLFYVKTDGTAFFKGTVGTGSKVEIFTVTVAAITGTASGAAGTGNVTSAAASVTLTNGTASYTYLWEHVGQILGETPTVSSSTAASPTFSRTAVDANEPSTSIWRVTVTDAKGNVASAQAYVRLIWIDTR